MDIEKLAHLVRSKRGRRGLRETAQAIGNVSPSTISRVENGKTPDMETFLALCDWLEVPPAELIKNTDLEKENETASNPSEALANWFRSDKNLDPAIAQVLASFIKVAYHDLSDRGKSDES